MSDNEKYIIGIDEAGRGPLAGPVFAAAVAVPRGWQPPRQKPLRDSKKLTPLQRKWWLEYIMGASDIWRASSFVTPPIIDRINITQAANRAATRSLQKLLGANLHLKNARIVLDGGLFVGNDYSNAETIIRADEQINAVKLASIVAKELRDKKMNTLHSKYSNYGFNTHKGYGTKTHREALAIHGPTSAHRRSFLRSKMNRIMNNKN